MSEAKEEDKAINKSELEQKSSETAIKSAPEDDSTSETKNKKVRLMLYVMVGIALGCILVWLVVGRIQSYVTDSDNVDLKKDIDKLNHDLKKETKKVEELDHKLEIMGLELEGVRNKNAYLHAELKNRQDIIDSLNGKVAAKDEKIIELNKIIVTLNNHVKELTRKNEAQEIVISDLKDDFNELYTDMRFIVSITNQELNRNQALVKEIDYLEAKVTEQNRLIGNLTWEVLDLKEKLKDERDNNVLDWIGYNLLKKRCNTDVKIKSVYKGSKQSCDSNKFYDTIKLMQPNLFLATENNTNLVFGGYTSQNWDSNGGFKEDAEAITFSATNKAICTLTRSQHAISTERERSNKKLMLTFGDYDITIVDDCMKTKMHEISVNQAYQCPKLDISPKNFYTEEKNPILTRFEFYTVEFVKP